MRYLPWLLVAACGGARPVATPDHALHVAIDYEAGAERIRVTGQRVALADLPLVELVGAELTGVGDVAIDVRVPTSHGQRDLRGATGDAVITCADCVLAEIPLRPRDPRVRAFTEGMRLGPWPLGRLDVHVKLGGGKLTVAEWKLTSADVRVELALELALARRLADSAVTGCLRFAPSAGLRARDPALAAALQMSGAAVARDGLFQVRLAGTVGELRRLGQVCDGSQPLGPIETPPETRPETRPEARPETPPETRPETPPAVAQPPAPGDPDAVAAELEAGIIRKTDTTYEVRRGLLERLTTAPSELARGARVVPFMSQGKVTGLKLYAIRPSSAYARLGFANGDAVTAINGFELTSADKLLEVYSRLREATSIEVELVRRGKPRTLRYQIVP